MSAEAKRSKPFVRLATREDCLILAQTMREEDIEECRLTLGLSAEQSLLLSFRLGETFTIQWGDEVVAMFGHYGAPGIYGVPWMLASPLLPKIAKSFLKECRVYVQALLEVYGHLENYVWVENGVHVKWLQWLGFEFDRPAPYGIEDQLFQRFYMKE
uniref:Internal virion protein n=1 Tax=Ralstonia phage BOESR1 TaxID=3034917 RepID=A0AA49ENA6_9CAUD|nr:internal virion protein [Ralstonia phage BOESR1]